MCSYFPMIMIMAAYRRAGETEWDLIRQCFAGAFLVAVTAVGFWLVFMQ